MCKRERRRTEREGERTAREGEHTAERKKRIKKRRRGDFASVVACLAPPTRPGPPTRPCPPDPSRPVVPPLTRLVLPLTWPCPPDSSCPVVPPPPDLTYPAPDPPSRPVPTRAAGKINFIFSLSLQLTFFFVFLLRFLYILDSKVTYSVHNKCQSSK